MGPVCVLFLINYLRDHGVVSQKWKISFPSSHALCSRVCVWCLGKSNQIPFCRCGRFNILPMLFVSFPFFLLFAVQFLHFPPVAPRGPRPVRDPIPSWISWIRKEN